MSNRILETTIKVSGERENVEIVLDRICNLWPCKVSPIRDTRDESHVYIRVVGVIK